MDWRFLAAAAFIVSPAGLQLRSRTRWFVEDPWGGARPLLWRDSLRMALDRPLAGYGPEVFSAAFPHYESAELARAYPDFAHESPHNIFLDAFVAQGVVGLVLLIAACVVGWAPRGERVTGTRGSRRRWRRHWRRAWSRSSSRYLPRRRR